jgi:hypothetical protein
MQDSESVYNTGREFKKNVGFDISSSMSVYDSQKRLGLMDSTGSKNGGNAKKFLINGLQESAEYDELKASMMDKMLIEFPIFSLNEDYMKALAMIIQSKIDMIKSLISNKQAELDFNENKIVVSPQIFKTQDFRPCTDHFTQQLKFHEVLDDQSQVDSWIQKQ